MSAVTSTSTSVSLAAEPATTTVPASAAATSGRRFHASVPAVQVVSIRRTLIVVAALGLAAARRNRSLAEATVTPRPLGHGGAPFS